MRFTVRGLLVIELRFDAGPVDKRPKEVDCRQYHQGLAPANMIEQKLL